MGDILLMYMYFHGQNGDNKPPPSFIYCFMYLKRYMYVLLNFNSSNSAVIKSIIFASVPTARKYNIYIYSIVYSMCVFGYKSVPFI